MEAAKIPRWDLLNNAWILSRGAGAAESAEGSASHPCHGRSAARRGIPPGKEGRIKGYIATQAASGYPVLEFPAGEFPRMMLGAQEERKTQECWKSRRGACESPRLPGKRPKLTPAARRLSNFAKATTHTLCRPSSLELPSQTRRSCLTFARTAASFNAQQRRARRGAMPSV